MEWIIPGTTLPAKREEANQVESHFRTIFATGGLVLSQIVAISGVEPYSVQNWCKRELLPGPQHKRYNMNQVCRILIINMLKSALAMEQICSLIGYINGDLEDECDDLIDDSKLYFMFVRLAAQARSIGDSESWNEALQEVAAEYREPVPGAREKLITVLRIMLTAWVSSQLRAQAGKMMEKLESQTP